MDRLLSSSLEKVIREDLGASVIKKIEKRIEAKYNVSLVDSIHDFYKIDSVLREFFGPGADGLEKKFIDRVCSLKKSSNQNYSKIEFSDPLLTKTVLEAFGDDDKKMILDNLHDEPLVISDVIDKLQIPQTSGYRKFNSLIKNGLLIVAGHEKTKDGKKVNKYKSLFQNIKINILKNKTSIDAQIDNDQFSSSSILQVVYSR